MSLERVMWTVARGKPKFAEMAMGLGRSLKLAGDPTPRAVLTDIPGYDWARYFDFVCTPTAPRSALDKLFAFEYLDAQRVYAIDGDCLALRRLDPVFAHGQGTPFAVQGTYQTQGKWHGAEVADVCRQQRVDRLPRFNGGALYYENHPDFHRLLAQMRAVESNYAESGFADFRGNASEEVCVALGMVQTGLGTVFDDDLDFMNTGAGLIGRLHLDVLKGECRFVCRRDTVRRVEPIVFHASAYSSFLVYWRQLDRLKALERYEDTHPRGHRSRAWKLRRTLERRWLKLTGRL